MQKNHISPKLVCYNYNDFEEIVLKNQIRVYKAVEVLSILI